MILWYQIEGMDPVQWSAGTAFRRGGKAGGLGMAKSPELGTYQKAVQEYLEHEYGLDTDNLPEAERIRLEFHITEVLRQGSGSDTGRKRNHRDATNYQKALEDALQGILYRNDAAVVDVRTILYSVERGEPFIGIGIDYAPRGHEPYGRYDW